MSWFSRKSNDVPETPSPVAAPAQPSGFTPNYTKGLVYVSDTSLQREVDGGRVADLLPMIYDNELAGRKRNNTYLRERFYDAYLGDAFMMAWLAAQKRFDPANPFIPDRPPKMDRLHLLKLIQDILVGSIRFVSNAYDDDLPDYFIVDLVSHRRWTLDEWGDVPLGFTYPDDPDKR